MAEQRGDRLSSPIYRAGRNLLGIRTLTTFKTKEWVSSYHSSMNEKFFPIRFGFCYNPFHFQILEAERQHLAFSEMVMQILVQILNNDRFS